MKRTVQVQDEDSKEELPEVYPVYYEKVSSKLATQDRFDNIERYFQEIVYIKRRNSIRYNFSFEVQLKLGTGTIQAIAKKDIFQFLKVTGDLFNLVSRFLNFKSQSKFLHFISIFSHHDPTAP